MSAAIATFSFANLAWLSTQALPLILCPSFIAGLLRPEYEPASSLEIYFARSLGFALLSLGLVVVVLSGSIPLTSAADAKPDETSPYASAALLLSALHHGSAAAYGYARYTWTAEAGYALGTLGSSALAVAALYCLLFAGDKAMTSRYHKFDQGTSGFPFTNSQSYRAKKKAL